MLSIVQKIPIITTVFSVIFFYQIREHWLQKNKPNYLFWWMTGVLCYGLGTLTESLVAVMGWREWIFKSWYILGALLGGFPLAQGSVFLIFSNRMASIMMYGVVAIVITASVLVIASPVNYELVESARLTGKVLGWKEVRYITPFINIYAFIFLVGGAAYSAYKYSRDRIYQNRFLGNVLIAVGGLLPGIGGSFTKFGYTEVLYVTELLGIVCIYIGYVRMKNDKTLSIYSNQV